MSVPGGGNLAPAPSSSVLAFWHHHRQGPGVVGTELLPSPRCERPTERLFPYFADPSSCCASSWYFFLFLWLDWFLPRFCDATPAFLMSSFIHRLSGRTSKGPPAPSSFYWVYHHFRIWLQVMAISFTPLDVPAWYGIFLTRLSVVQMTTLGMARFFHRHWTQLTVWFPHLLLPPPGKIIHFVYYIPAPTAHFSLGFGHSLRAAPSFLYMVLLDTIEMSPQSWALFTPFSHALGHGYPLTQTSCPWVYLTQGQVPGLIKRKNLCGNSLPHFRALPRDLRLLPVGSGNLPTGCAFHSMWTLWKRHSGRGFSTPWGSPPSGSISHCNSKEEYSKCADISHCMRPVLNISLSPILISLYCGGMKGCPWQGTSRFSI